MRSGRHFARFTLVLDGIMMFGVVRLAWDVEGGENAHGVDGQSFYYTDNGRRFPGNRHWEGRQPARQSDRIGMLLDLDQGSMTVWKNEMKLGVMQVEGLGGPLCWAVQMYTPGRHRGSVRIESPLAPPSPTEEELAVMMAWQRRTRLGLPATAADAECDAAEAAGEVADDGDH